MPVAIDAVHMVPREKSEAEGTGLLCISRSIGHICRVSGT